MEIYNNWQEEKRSAYLYQIMADHEKNILHKKLFLDLKDAAENQAKTWENKINNPNFNFIYQPDLRTRLVVLLISWLGTENLHYMLSAMKIRGMSVFTQYHSEHRHTGVNSASNLRAAVFGINDGLISNLGLILGVAGASSNPHTIVLAGVSGLLAGAFSMGGGEYVSVLSQREVFEYQIALEKQELEEYPEEEKKELSLIYEARGLKKEEADQLAKLLIDNPETGLNTLAREELGLNPDDLVSPTGAAIASFFSFGLGAFIPLLPFIISHSSSNLIISIVITAVSLFVIGGILSLFTNRHPLVSGMRMLLIGAITGSVTFIIGRFIGITF